MFILILLLRPTLQVKKFGEIMVNLTWINWIYFDMDYLYELTCIERNTILLI